ncbi:DUF4112 domain-containing protein [Sphingosinicella microcystinivorans]|uniref:DUF4112 domain-containing protein n=1 Tax=Sphingosinicella microcystinivorans TaxID=335406 RepID=UPI0022F3B748|nr:DUF4112 domain-containing protein [Sphingosinicella microcystinivorans]WBX86432.1 DUF4112 domain-containing protein [Sphingosinicella microcystinivorans]
MSRAGFDSRDPHAVRARVEALEALLERSITIPGINYKIGLDAVLGLVPVGGDIIAGLMSAYIIWEARNLGMSRWSLARMAGNTLFDTAIGFVPLLGDAMDVVFRSNTRNLRIIRKHLDRHHPKTAVLEGTITRRAR